MKVSRDAVSTRSKQRWRIVGVTFSFRCLKNAFPCVLRPQKFVTVVQNKMQPVAVIRDHPRRVPRSQELQPISDLIFTDGDSDQEVGASVAGPR